MMVYIRSLTKKNTLIKQVIFIFCLCITPKLLLAIPKHPSYVVIDYNSGVTLEGKNQNKRMYPASLTKLMTLYILFEKIQEGKIKLNDKFYVSRKATTMPSSKIWLRAGSRVPVKKLINAVIVKSANDVAWVIAENVAKSEPRFVRLMNATARRMGLKNTHFTNPTGLTQRHEYSTAHDMAILARNLITRFNNFYYLFSQKSFHWKSYSYHATNHLLGFDHIDGMKTGYTYAAGFNLVTSTQVKGIRIIAVTLGQPSSQKRDNFMRHLVSNSIHLAQNLRINRLKYHTPPKTLLAANNAVEAKNNDNDYDINDLENSTSKQNVSYSLSSNKDEDENGVNPVSYSQKGSNSISNSIKGKYFLQLGVFSNKSNAKKILKVAYKKIASLKKLATKKISTVNMDKSKLYRVRLYGLSYKEANKACEILKNDNYNCFTQKL